MFTFWLHKTKHYWSLHLPYFSTRKVCWNMRPYWIIFIVHSPSGVSLQRDISSSMRPSWPLTSFHSIMGIPFGASIQTWQSCKLKAKYVDYERVFIFNINFIVYTLIPWMMTSLFMTIDNAAGIHMVCFISL